LDHQKKHSLNKEQTGSLKDYLLAQVFELASKMKPEKEEYKKR
jgi:hypothetical protein